jgi:hypothetical protein
MSCTHTLLVAVVRATGTDPFSANVPLQINIVLDFRVTESPDTQKDRTFHANMRENPTLSEVYSPERMLIARSNAIPAEKEAK